MMVYRSICLCGLIMSAVAMTVNGNLRHSNDIAASSSRQLQLTTSSARLNRFNDDLTNTVSTTTNKKNKPLSADEAVVASSTADVVSAFTPTNNDRGNVVRLGNGNGKSNKSTTSPVATVIPVVVDSDTGSHSTDSSNTSSTSSAFAPAEPVSSGSGGDESAATDATESSEPSSASESLNGSSSDKDGIKADALNEQQDISDSDTEKGNLKEFVVVAIFGGVALISAMVFVISHRISKDCPESDDEEDGIYSIEVGRKHEPVFQASNLTQKNRVTEVAL